MKISNIVQVGDILTTTLRVLTFAGVYEPKTSEVIVTKNTEETIDCVDLKGEKHTITYDSVVLINGMNVERYIKSEDTTRRWGA